MSQILKEAFGIKGVHCSHTEVAFWARTWRFAPAAVAVASNASMSSASGPVSTVWEEVNCRLSPALQNQYSQVARLFTPSRRELRSPKRWCSRQQRLPLLLNKKCGCRHDSQQRLNAEDLRVRLQSSRSTSDHRSTDFIRSVALTAGP